VLCRIPWDVETSFAQDNGLGGAPGPYYCVLACEQWNSPLYCDSEHPQVICIQLLYLYCPQSPQCSVSSLGAALSLSDACCLLAAPGAISRICAWEQWTYYSVMECVLRLAIRFASQVNSIALCMHATFVAHMCFTCRDSSLRLWVLLTAGYCRHPDTMGHRHSSGHEHLPGCSRARPSEAPAGQRYCQRYWGPPSGRGEQAGKHQSLAGSCNAASPQLLRCV
jgi:hypothetical protein